ncbi:MAG: hypothetical protein QN174_13250 [Armatimonadota bacterium]|nr:hypothetical protein [Armatimonadota bacterium]MDR7422415.1 hypothetical protein [Armatimonadota bacterium]MDR7453952.1 hypothetical protein [Armatimonadota bacterium]MDR7457178.1 hypothetical protein [Armatimonadota bacterium]MDR7497910.1 hypothetical protein [Armatimonadota bacterium]
MHVVFIDEAGYTPDWKAGIEQQPFYVASAVCIPAPNVPPLYASLRQEIQALHLPSLTRFKLPHLLEMSLGDSRYSIGLQVADYFATTTYHYYMDGKPASCGWWDLLAGSLHRLDGKLIGIGLKEFP